MLWALFEGADACGRAETIASSWDDLLSAAEDINDKISDDYKPSFFQLVLYPVAASANLGKMLISAGLNNLRASQARLSTNDLADQVQDLFETDYDLEVQYHTLLDGEFSVSV